MTLTSERLERMRHLARIERSAVLEQKGRHGEDPLTTLTHIPSVDEFVVNELRLQMLEDRGMLSEFALARLAGQGTDEDADMHRRNADRAEFDLLREIAEIYPDLATAVWTISDRLDVVDER